MKSNSIILESNVFLQRLADVANAPKQLHYMGTLPEVPGKVVSIVGSRRPTIYGREVTSRFAGELAAKGVIIVSGLAIGVDAIAHTAALDAGGITVAVLPSSFDMFYPRTNWALAERIIASGGAIISEYPEGTSPHQFRFLERNRLVSGLGDVVIVTEANIRSGTLSTVAHALEQGREVYAVPGPITSPLSAGCNRLILQGAAPLLETTQLTGLLGLDARPKHRRFGDTPAETTLLQMLARGISDGETLLAASGLDAQGFNTTLSLMEIKGFIRPLGGNRWQATQ